MFFWADPFTLLTTTWIQDKFETGGTSRLFVNNVLENQEHQGTLSAEKECWQVKAEHPKDL